MATNIKRSIVYNGHKTSVSLENEFWDGLREIARAQETPLTKLVQRIDQGRHGGNLSSAIRVFVFNHMRAQIAGTKARLIEEIEFMDRVSADRAGQVHNINGNHRPRLKLMTKSIGGHCLTNGCRLVCAFGCAATDSHNLGSAYLAKTFNFAQTPWSPLPNLRNPKRL